jgi:ubiquinone/menaquinone biosynthesis C-methylase UbiE
MGVSRHYADVLGDDDPTRSGIGPQAMISAVVPRIYERLWRPLFAPVLMAGRRDEQAMALQMLELEPGDSVLDVGCGPGNFTRAFARASGDGLVVGLDASRTMLDQAAREPNPPNVRYVRGDAAALPFPDATFDAVCCFAALYFIERPLQAIDEIVRVLAPGGRVALLASVSRGPLPAGAVDAVVRRASGTRVFGRDELTRALADRGLADVAQRVAGLAQFVSARQRQ